MLTRGPHTYILNSRALELSGIDETTPDPGGGWIVRDANGVPTGRVLESARRMVNRAMPPSPPIEREEGIATMKTVLDQLASLGITSVNIAGVRPNRVRWVQELYERWGEVVPRAVMQIRLSPGHDNYDDAEVAPQLDRRARGALVPHGIRERPARAGSDQDEHRRRALRSGLLVTRAL
jgi:predicted amidohydrolase YtcJ